MDEMPNYSKYTLDQLYDVYDHVDREKYPDRFTIVVQEIEKRKSLPVLAGSEIIADDQNTAVQPSNLTLEFRGSANEYFRIWIVNLCLALLTLGIFSAWAKVRKKRYFYSHTILDGTPFQYLAQPIPILKGRVIAAVLFLIYYVSSLFFTSLLPYVVAVGMLLAPWIVIRSAAFNARYSAFRNMTFQFHGKYLDALKVLYAWGLIPAVAVSFMFDWFEHYVVFGILFAIFGLAFPWWMKSLKSFIITFTSFGQKKGEFTAAGRQFFKIYFISGLIIIASGLVTVLLSVAFAAFFKESQFSFMVFSLVIPIYAGYVLAYAYAQAHTGNLVWNHTKLGQLRFQSTLLGRGLAKLYLSNALGIIVSAGLLIPWAVIRTLKYRADHMQVLLDGGFAEFESAKTSTVQAMGAETMDFFDVDFSI